MGRVRAFVCVRCYHVGSEGCVRPCWALSVAGVSVPGVVCCVCLTSEGCVCLRRVCCSCVPEGSEERVRPCWVLGCALRLSWLLRGPCACVSYGLCVMLVLRGVCLGYVEGLLPRWLLRAVSVRAGSECRVGSRCVLGAVCTCVGVRLALSLSVLRGVPAGFGSALVLRSVCL